jgi:hypothetical protein
VTFTSLVGVVILLALLGLRIIIRQPQKQKRTPAQRLRTARMLLGALIALMAIGYRLSQTNRSLHGQTGHQPSVMERIVMSLSR